MAKRRAVKHKNKGNGKRRNSFEVGSNESRFPGRHAAYLRAFRDKPTLNISRDILEGRKDVADD